MQFFMFSLYITSIVGTNGQISLFAAFAWKYMLNNIPTAVEGMIQQTNAYADHASNTKRILSAGATLLDLK